MVIKGNPNSVADVVVGAIALRSCIQGEFINVRINIAGLDDKQSLMELLEKSRILVLKARDEEEEILKILDDKIRNV